MPFDPAAGGRAYRRLTTEIPHPADDGVPDAQVTPLARGGQLLGGGADAVVADGHDDLVALPFEQQPRLSRRAGVPAYVGQDLGHHRVDLVRHVEVDRHLVGHRRDRDRARRVLVEHRREVASGLLIGIAAHFHGAVLQQHAQPRLLLAGEFGEPGAAGSEAGSLTLH